jgi:hypothetical protein
VLFPADEDRDALLRVVLLVWTSATLVGVVGRALRAAAAAAALSEEVLDSRRVKAEMAAVAALGLAVEALRGCEEMEEVELARDARLRMAMAAKGYLNQTGVGREHCPAGPVEGREADAAGYTALPLPRGESSCSMTSPPTLELCDKEETAAGTRRTGLGGRRRLDPNMASRYFATGYDRALYGIVLSHAPKPGENRAGERTAD